MSRDRPTGGHEQALREALHDHVRLAPDADAVHERITAGVARRRRRREVAGLGGVALAVTGLLLGAEALVSSPDDPAAPPAAAPSPDGPPPTAPRDPQGAQEPPEAAPADVPPPAQLAREAFLASGYTYEDAVVLAELWRSDAGRAKAVAGQRLLGGAPLPVAPGSPAASAGDQPPVVDEAVDAFFAAGLSEQDASALADLWQEDDLMVVKAVAGQQLLDGAAVPGQLRAS